MVSESMEWTNSDRENAVTMGKDLLKGLVASALVAVVLAFGSMRIASGNIADVLEQPGFWWFYLKVASWLFVVGFLSSVLTVVLIRGKERTPMS